MSRRHRPGSGKGDSAEAREWYTAAVRLILGVAAAVALMASPAMAFTPDEPWPPADGPGVLFVHYGEEHWNDADGGTLLPKIVEVAAKYRPNLVTMSGDKDNDGEADQLEKWREIMSAYDKAGVPYFAGVGNHDRDAPARRGGGRAAAGPPQQLPRGLQGRGPIRWATPRSTTTR